MEDITSIFPDFGKLIVQICIVSTIVLIAMLIDLCAGLYKAKISGKFRSSWGLKRTIQKFILYQGAVLLAGCIDLLFTMGMVFRLIHLDMIHGVSIVTVLIGVILLIVEIWSLRESATEKTRKEVDKVLEIIGGVIDRDKIGSAVTNAITDAISNTPKEESNDNLS